MRRRERHREDPAADVRDQRRPLGADRVEHGRDVGHELLERRQRGGRDRVRQARPPLVEHDQPPERRQALAESSASGGTSHWASRLPNHWSSSRMSGGPVADDLVREVEVAQAGVPRLGDHRPARVATSNGRGRPMAAPSASREAKTRSTNRGGWRGSPDRGAQASGAPAQALELAPQALARPALPPDERDHWPGLRHDRRAVVHVAGRGDGGADTRLDRPHDLDDALAIGDERLHPIARANLRRRLRRRSIHEDVAALAQPGRKRAGLHEAHRAQPAIDTRLVGGEGIGHAFQDGTRDVVEASGLGPLESQTTDDPSTVTARVESASIRRTVTRQVIVSGRRRSTTS